MLNVNFQSAVTNPQGEKLFTVQSLRLNPFKPMGKSVPMRHTVAQQSESKLSVGGLMEAFSWTDAFGSPGNKWNRLDFITPTQPLDAMANEEQHKVWEQFQVALGSVSIRLIYNGNNSTTKNIRMKLFPARRTGALITAHIWTEEHFRKYASAADGNTIHRNPLRDILQRTLPVTAFQGWRDNPNRSLVDRFADGEVKPHVSMAAFYPREIYLLNLDPRLGRFMTKVNAFEIPTGD